MALQMFGRLTATSFFLPACMLLLLLELVAYVNAVENSKSQVPTGHLQKLGSHRPREGHVAVLDELPHPIEFYKEFTSPRIPAVFKGAAKTMPAFKLWTDAYLKEKSGEEDVQIEPGKKENRTRVAIEGHEAPFGEFLDIYNTSDIYMVDPIPKPIEGELSNK